MLNNTLIRMLLCKTIQDTRRRVPPYEIAWWMQMSLSEVLDGEVDSRSRSTRATGDSSNRSPEIRICCECLPFLFTTTSYFLFTILSSLPLHHSLLTSCPRRYLPLPPHHPPRPRCRPSNSPHQNSPRRCRTRNPHPQAPAQAPCCRHQRLRRHAPHSQE